jgi:hypothetical protein
LSGDAGIQSQKKIATSSTPVPGARSDQSKNVEKQVTKDGSAHLGFRKNIPNELPTRKENALTISGLKSQKSEALESSRSENFGPAPTEEQKPIEKTQTSEQTESGLEKHGRTGMTETAKSIVSTNVNDETGETQPDTSQVSPINLEEARSRSMNLIDDTAKHLLGYMKSIGKDCEVHQALRDYRNINAVANLAKQVASLAKVKLDAIKEARK